jgi:hypothetical protein
MTRPRRPCRHVPIGLWSPVATMGGKSSPWSRRSTSRSPRGSGSSRADSRGHVRRAGRYCAMRTASCFCLRWNAGRQRAFAATESVDVDAGPAETCAGNEGAGVSRMPRPGYDERLVGTSGCFGQRAGPLAPDHSAPCLPLGSPSSPNLRPSDSAIVANRLGAPRPQSAGLPGEEAAVSGGSLRPPAGAAAGVRDIPRCSRGHLPRRRMQPARSTP